MVRSPCSIITPGIDFVFFWNLFTIYFESRRFKWNNKNIENYIFLYDHHVPLSPQESILYFFGTYLWFILSPEGLNEIIKIFKIIFFVRSPCSVITPGIDRVFFWMLFTIYLKARRFWVQNSNNIPFTSRKTQTHRHHVLPASSSIPLQTLKLSFTSVSSSTKHEFIILPPYHVNLILSSFFFISYFPTRQTNLIPSPLHLLIPLNFDST